MAKKEILTERQKMAITLVANEPNLSNFYLSGGTALSVFYLEHRLSDDLDFFCEDAVDYATIHAFTEKLKQELGAKDLRHERLFDRNIFFLKFSDGELKLEFTKYPFKHLGRVTKHLEIAVDSVRDLAANKLAALIDRFDPKDFVDLYFLLKKFKLAAICRDVEKKFGMKINDMTLGSELAKVRRIVALPIMIKPLNINNLKIFFAEQTKKIGANILE